jgi:glycosyltransferase involved in cell wall biosynthesis
MTFCFLGAYDPAYPRNSVLRHGLALNGVRVREARLPSSAKFWLRYPYGLARYTAAAAKSDIIFVPEFCQKDVPLARFFSLLFAKRLVFDPVAARYETKIIDWRRRKPGTLRARWNFWIDRMSLGLPELILADTRAHKDYYCRTYGLPEEKVAVLPIGYDDRLFKPAPPRPAKAEPFTVLFFGSFLPLHGVENIVGAAALVGRKDPTVRFKFVGSGQTLEPVRVRADCYGLQNVEFEGWLKPGELPLRIAAADICLGLFGTTEKAGRVVPHKVFQAMGMNKPVITARTEAVQEFFHHGKNIFLCDAPYPESLAAAILALKKDARLRRGLAEQGYRLVSKEFAPRVLGLKLLRILDRFPPGTKRGGT